MKKIIRVVAFLVCAMLLVSAAFAKDSLAEECSESVAAATSGDTAGTYASRNPPLTQYDLLEMVGTVVKDNGDPTYDKTESFGRQYGAPEASFTTKYSYCPNHPMTFTFYKYGNGNIGFDNNPTVYSRDGTGTPYGFVFDSYGDAVGYKVDDVINMKKKTLPQVTLVSTARSRIAPHNTYVRKVTVSFKLCKDCATAAS